MRIRRPLAAAGIALAVGSAMLGTGPAGASKKPGLTFEKPVALNSFSPLRTAVGTVYSAEDGEQGSDHEWAGEPSLQVDNKGTIFIAGTCCVSPAAPVWYSKDGGKTFAELESPGHVREWGIGAEGDLAVDQEGHVFFVDTYVPGMVMSRWSENGDTWDFTSPTTGVVPGLNDRPWLAYSDQGIYMYVNYGVFTQVYVSTDGGLTWLANDPNTWEGSTSGQPFFPGHVAADEKKGTMWLTGVVPDNSAVGQLGSHVSTDGGKTFREALVSKPQRKGGFSPVFTGAAAVDAAGNGYTTWSTFDKEGCDVYYAVSTDMGKSWNDPVKVNRTKGCATFPWITAGADGKIGIAWYQTPVTSTAPAPTTVQERQRALEMGNPGDLSKAPLLAFQDEVDENAPWHVHVAAITGATGARPKIYEGQVPTKTPIMVGPLNRELWDFFQLDIGPDGRLYIAYVVKYKDSAPQTWFVKTASGPKLN